MFDSLETDDVRWAAIAARDPSADGRFFCCVRTTGVYCRPSCAGRPHRKNVFFAETRAEAEQAGLRPCKRCRPDRLAPGSVEERIDAIDWDQLQAALDGKGHPLTLKSAERLSPAVAAWADLAVGGQMRPASIGSVRDRRP